MARYALKGLPSKVLAAEYRTALPDEKLLAEELERTRRMLEGRQQTCIPGRVSGRGSSRPKAKTPLLFLSRRDKSFACCLRKVTSGRSAAW